MIDARNRRMAGDRSIFLRSQQNTMRAAVAGGVVFKDGEAGVLNERGVFIPLRDKNAKKYVRGYVADSNHFKIQNLHDKNVARMEVSRTAQEGAVGAVANLIFVVVTAFSPVDANFGLNRDFLFLDKIFGLFKRSLTSTYGYRGKDNFTPMANSAMRFGLR